MGWAKKGRREGVSGKWGETHALTIANRFMPNTFLQSHDKSYELRIAQSSYNLIGCSQSLLNTKIHFVLTSILSVHIYNCVR